MTASAAGTGNREPGTGTTEPQGASSAGSSFPVPDSQHPGTIAAKQFTFWYGAKQALHDVNLTIPSRAVTALIGPSGCGKSTFLRSINRLNALIPGARHDGAIELDGEDMYGAAMTPSRSGSESAWCSSDGIRFRNPIYDNVAYGPRINGARLAPATGRARRAVAATRRALG